MKSTVWDLQGKICPPGLKNSYRQKGQSRRSCLWRREKTSCSQTCALNIWYARRMLLLVPSHSLRTSSKGTNSPCGLRSGSAWQKGVTLEAWGSARSTSDWQQRCSLVPFSSLSILHLPASPTQTQPGPASHRGFSWQSVEELNSPWDAFAQSAARGRLNSTSARFRCIFLHSGRECLGNKFCFCKKRGPRSC